MGVPSLFQYLKTRYPVCVQKVDENSPLPVYDNLFIDFNSLIHDVKGGNDDVVYCTTYEVFAARLFVELDRLISFVNPQKLVYIAIDGTVPRCKLTQQRSRRFESSRKQGNCDNSENEIFDSNVISPGTEFMERINEVLKYYIKMRMETNPAFRKIQFIYSSHRHSGEGEHKIMNYLRDCIKSGEYNDNERSLVFGSDADMIFLVSSLHQQNIDIMRKELPPRGIDAIGYHSQVSYFFSLFIIGLLSFPSFNLSRDSIYGNSRSRCFLAHT